MNEKWKIKKDGATSEISPEEVVDIETNPQKRYDYGRYTGRLLNPDELFPAGGGGPSASHGPLDSGEA
jgi:hypothetical protein